jgi:threonine/homoserine/homoserine lactone efflux protein
MPGVLRTGGSAYAGRVLAEYLVTVLILEITPGPNLGYLAGLSATRGRAAGLAATAGVAAGLSLHAVAASFGVAALIERSALAYEALRWAGVAMLLWLAVEAWRDAGESSPASVAGSSDARRLMWRGFLTNVLNPKSALFFIAVVPRFVDPGRPAAEALALLGGIYVAVATAVHASVVLLAARLQPLLVAGGRERTVRRALALLLAAIAVWLAWGTAR